MSGAFRNRLLQYEATPPDNAWENISRELDRIVQPFDSVVASRLYGASAPPPPAAWPAINALLDNETRTPGKVAPLRYKRLAIAVAAMAAVAFTIFYLSGDGRRQPAERLVAGLTRTRPDLQTKSLPVPSPASAITLVPQAFSGRTIGTISSPYTESDLESDASQSDPFENISEEYFTDMKPVDTEQPVVVPAKPIRDADGNIIMDEKLIHQPDDPYITVTSPSGTQTKISSKFLGFLSYLNDNDPRNEGSDYDETIWKDKFKAWREKLLNENSFIPAASNFFDIFEMKDIIEE